MGTLDRCTRCDHFRGNHVPACRRPNCDCTGFWRSADAMPEPQQPETEETLAQRLLAGLGWTLHPPGQSCIDSPHTFKGRHDTSFAASVYVAPKAGTYRRRILDALTTRGPATDVQIQTALGIAPNTERPRRVELVEGGFVQDSGQRIRHEGQEHIVWQAVERREL